jgi:hypothetical protein
MCSRSGEALATAPIVAGSNGPRLPTRRAKQKSPLPISNCRERMSRCGGRSPARWRIGPRTMAPTLEALAAAVPVGTWSETITACRSVAHRAFAGEGSAKNEPRAACGLLGRNAGSDVAKEALEAPRRAEEVEPHCRVALVRKRVTATARKDVRVTAS